MATNEKLSLEEMVRHIYNTTNRMEATLADQQTRINACETNVQVLNRQVYDLQNVVNLREQELRGLTIRINGFPYTDEEKTSDSKALSKRVYDRILFPMLNYAKSRNEINKVPTINNTISSCYRVGLASAKTNTANRRPSCSSSSTSTSGWRS
jgi:predicted RNase H-like nuclease (RuvC/YqgF family)